MTRQRLPPVTHTDALFADQSHSILHDLAALVSMAVWYLENPGPNMAIWELYRRQAGVPLKNYCVAVDFGQSVDNCAICVMSRTSAPALEPAVEPAERTAPPPDLASPEWQHEIA